MSHLKACSKNNPKEFNKKIGNILRRGQSESRFFPLRALPFVFVYNFGLMTLVDFILSSCTSRFVLFAAGTGDDQTLKDEDAPSKKNAAEKRELEEDKEGRILQSLERTQEGQGSDAADTQHRSGAREAGQDLQTKEQSGVEGGKYSKEEDEDDHEAQTELSSEGSGVDLEGVDDVEQRGERQGVLGMQQEVALLAEYNNSGGSRMGVVDKVLEGEGTKHTPGGEPAEWSPQRPTPAQQLGEPSEEVGGRGKAEHTTQSSDFKLYRM